MYKTKTLLLNIKQRQSSDIYVHQRILLGYRSRAALKLVQLNQKYKLLKPGDSVLDCGCAPGGWSQAAVELTGGVKPRQYNNQITTKSKSLIIGVDLIAVEPIPGAHMICGDIHHQKVLDEINLLIRLHKDKVPSTETQQNTTVKVFNALISDMAHPFAGNKSIDEARISELCHFALGVSKTYLKADGKFVCKYLKGSSDAQLIDVLAARFRDFKTFKPKASRDESSEMYFVGFGFKG